MYCASVVCACVYRCGMCVCVVWYVPVFVCECGVYVVLYVCLCVSAGLRVFIGQKEGGGQMTPLRSG